MIVPNLRVGTPTRILSSSAPSNGSPRDAFDLFDAQDILPRDPWIDLAAGQAPAIKCESGHVEASFAMALERLSWEGFDLYESAGNFWVAMAQQVDVSWRAWVASARILRIELKDAPTEERWVGRVSFDLSRVYELAPVDVLASERVA